MSDLTYREIEDSHELSHIPHGAEQELLTLNMGRTTPPRTGCCACSRRSRARSCATSSR